MVKQEIQDIHVPKGVKTQDLVRSFNNLGFQASKLAEAASLVKEMREQECKIFLSFTSNMVASGLRGVFVDFIKKGYVDAIVTAGGSIDHDIIKSYKPYLLGDFELEDVRLHQGGLNRLGNIVVPNSRYTLLEKKIQPQLRRLYTKQKIVSPRELASFIGSSIKDTGSILYWCNKKKIPMYCPGITDSAVGLQLFLFKQDHKDFIVDVTRDMQELADLVFEADKTGGVILGGGISKHHILGVNLLRGGLDYSVYITTASPHDGSLSGAPPPEAKSWGKIREKGKTTTVYGDATIIFPLIVATI